MTKYIAPDFATRRIFNPAVAFATRMGLSMRGSRLLVVRGRKSGEWRMTPVNLLAHDGSRYLVAPRGNTQWVRNVRAAGEAFLRLGRSKEQVRLVELPDDQKAPVIRAYLKLWKMEAGKFFEGVTDASPDDEIRRISPDHPVFRVESALSEPLP